MGPSTLFTWLDAMNSTQVASHVLAAWGLSPHGEGEMVVATPPTQNVLERLLATAFDASLLREENRPLMFRLLFINPDELPQAAGPPDGLHRLEFDVPRPFTSQELRRLTPAVDFDRSLVGVCQSAQGELLIWGIVQSGARWLEQFHGGRGQAWNLPDCLIVGVRDPGYMVISRGSRPLCEVEAGAIRKNGFNVFKSLWLPASFQSNRDELWKIHARARSQRRGAWAELHPSLTGTIAQQMVQRLISTIQRSRHGGTLLVVPTEREDEFANSQRWVKLKYKFAQAEPRMRFRSLIGRVMNRLAEIGSQLAVPSDSVGWDDYGRAADAELASLDEAVFELSHMMATLTAVDGAVVLTKRFELLGFGAEIAGSLLEVGAVARALDLEGASFRMEPTEDVGTRHRSVYRLCNVLDDVLGIVVSQDGGARFIRRKGVNVMYWDHSSITPA